MKTLYLLRHAKSDQNTGLDDHERPLNARGRKTALLIGAHLHSHAYLIDHIFCSSSLRTRQTVEGLLHTYKKDTPVTFSKKLYLASPGELLLTLQQAEDTIRHLMIVGHNPDIHRLCLLLIKEGNPRTISELHHKFPTGALAIMQAKLDHWKDLGPVTTHLIEFLTIPK